MNENVENLILAQLREIRGEMASMRQQMDREFGAIRADIRDLDQKTDGLSLVLTMLAGHVHAIDGRVERLDERVGRLDGRVERLEARLA